MWDLRIPTGVFFTLLGAILVIVSVLPGENRAALTDANVNLYSGASMLIFGGVLLWLARRHRV